MEKKVIYTQVTWIKSYSILRSLDLFGYSGHRTKRVFGYLGHWIKRLFGYLGDPKYPNNLFWILDPSIQIKVFGSR